MGIYIKGMEMPKCCAECPINHDAECLICNNMVCNEPYTQKADWCPLVEVPPHGRLIDADKLRAEFPHPNDWRNPNLAYAHLSGIWATIDCAETIIEAEDGT